MSTTSSVFCIRNPDMDLEWLYHWFANDIAYTSKTPWKALDERSDCHSLLICSQTLIIHSLFTRIDHQLHTYIHLSSIASSHTVIIFIIYTKEIYDSVIALIHFHCKANALKPHLQVAVSQKLFPHRRVFLHIDIVQLFNSMVAYSISYTWWSQWVTWEKLMSIENTIFLAFLNVHLFSPLTLTANTYHWRHN